ncbi:hypothetical protein CPB86DRAFT_82304 [Serendipita vermifera]|nr:hypothetical protein CPB86DRAFT_82304 [Serendipita vermifera]
MSLFGSTNTAKPFGFSGTSTPTGTTNLFGGNTTNAFGATPAAGSTTTPAANPFAPASATPGAPTAGGFGATPFGAQNTAAGTMGTGLFGAAGTGTGAATTGTGLFGAAQPAAGATNTNPAAAGTSGGLGLFGQPAANIAAGAPGTPAPGSTGLFGQPVAGSTAAPSTGLFGQPAATNAPATGGLFGQPAQATAGANTAPTGLFGQPAASGMTTPGGTMTAPTGGLFGTTPAAGTTAGATAFGGGGLFGAKPAGGLFGSTTTATTPGAGLFGSTTARPGGLFGNSTTTGGFGLGTSALGVMAQQQQQQQQQQQPGSLNAHGQALLGLLTKLQQLQQAIQMQMSQGLQISSTSNSGHQESLEFVGKLGALLYSLTTEKFQHVFYNVVDPAQVSLYTRPVYVSDGLWEKAVKENPDPRRMVPAFAMGTEDLQKRADAQAKAAEACKVKLDEIRTKLTALSQRHVLSTSLRSQKLSNNHTLLFQRAVRLSQHLHLLIPLVRSSAIRPEEEMLRARLESIEDELRRGNASKGKMNEMWGAVGQLTALKAREGMGVEGKEGKEWAVVDEEGLKRLARVRFLSICNLRRSLPFPCLGFVVRRTGSASANAKPSRDLLYLIYSRNNNTA